MRYWQNIEIFARKTSIEVYYRKTIAENEFGVIE